VRQSEEWHGRAAGEIARKMSVSPQTNPL